MWACVCREAPGAPPWVSPPGSKKCFNLAGQDIYLPGHIRLRIARHCCFIFAGWGCPGRLNQFSIKPVSIDLLSGKYLPGDKPVPAEWHADHI